MAPTSLMLRSWTFPVAVIRFANRKRACARPWDSSWRKPRAAGRSRTSWLRQASRSVATPTARAESWLRKRSVLQFRWPPSAQCHAPNHSRAAPEDCEGGTVVIAKGLITAVGKDVPIPPEAWVIDGKGLTAYPGLIDALTDLGLTAAPGAPGGPGAVAQTISRGPQDRPGTTPWRSAADEIKPDDKRLESWRNTGFTTALSAPQGGIFPGQGVIINLAGERAAEMVAKAPATLQISLQPTGSFVSFPGSLMGVHAYVKQVFADTEWYAQAAAIYDAHPRDLERPAYDRTERVLNDALRSRQLVLLPANNAVQIIRALDLAEKLNLRVVLYGGQQGDATAVALAAETLPELVSL